MTTETPTGADLLYGVAAIAEYLGIPERACQHRIDAGEIPTFRLSDKPRSTICARRTSLRGWLAALDVQARANG